MLAMSSWVIVSSFERQAVERQQEPAAELLVDRMMAIAHGRLCHLRDQGLRVAQQQPLQRAVPVKLVLEALAAQSIGVPGTLHDRAVRRRLAAHEQRDADQALVAHYRDLRRRAVVQHVEQ